MESVRAQLGNFAKMRKGNKMFKFEIEKTEYVANIRKEGKVVVDATKLPQAAIEHLIAKGVQRLLNDAIGSNELFPTIADKIAHAEKMRDDLYNGILGRTPVAQVDNVTKEARIIARDVLKANLIAQGKKYSVFTALEMDARNTILDKLIERNPDFTTQAEKAIATRKEVQNSIDLADFGL